MNKLDLVRQYLDSEKITGTKIFYGSCIESHSDAKDAVSYTHLTLPTILLV